MFKHQICWYTLCSYWPYFRAIQRKPVIPQLHIFDPWLITDTTNASNWWMSMGPRGQLIPIYDYQMRCNPTNNRIYLFQPMLSSQDDISALCWSSSPEAFCTLKVQNIHALLKLSIKSLELAWVVNSLVTFLNDLLPFSFVFTHTHTHTHHIES